MHGQNHFKFVTYLLTERSLRNIKLSRGDKHSPLDGGNFGDAVPKMSRVVDDTMTGGTELIPRI